MLSKAELESWDKAAWRRCGLSSTNFTPKFAEWRQVAECVSKPHYPPRPSHKIRWRSNRESGLCVLLEDRKAIRFGFLVFQKRKLEFVADIYGSGCLTGLFVQVKSVEIVSYRHLHFMDDSRARVSDFGSPMDQIA